MKALALSALIALTASGTIAGAAATPGAAAAAPPRTSLPAIERAVMCVTCKIPLNVAESVQAERERALIRGLIAAGETQPQIERSLVAQYGPAVLALPSAHGFDLTAYLVPLGAMLALVAALVLLLPRWRKRARAQAAERAAGAAAPPTLAAADQARLDADLARFDR